MRHWQRDHSLVTLSLCVRDRYATVTRIRIMHVVPGGARFAPWCPVRPVVPPHAQSCPVVPHHALWCPIMPGRPVVGALYHAQACPVVPRHASECHARH